MPIICTFVPPSGMPSLYKYLDGKNLPHHEGHSLGDFTQFFREHGDQDGYETTAEPKPPTGFETGIYEQHWDQFKALREKQVPLDDEEIEHVDVTESLLKSVALKLASVEESVEENIKIEPESVAESGDPNILEKLEAENKSFKIPKMAVTERPKRAIFQRSKLPAKDKPLDDCEEQPVAKNIDVEEHILKAVVVKPAPADALEEEAEQKSMMQKPLACFLVKDAVDDFDLADLLPETPIVKKVRFDSKSVAVETDDLKNILGRLGSKQKPFRIHKKATTVITKRDISQRSRKLPAVLPKTPPNKESPKKPNRAVTQRSQKLPAKVEETPENKESSVKTSRGRIVKRPSFAGEVDRKSVKVEGEPAKKKARVYLRSGDANDSIIGVSDHPRSWVCVPCQHDFGRRAKLVRHWNKINPCVQGWIPTTASVSTRRSLPVAKNIPSPLPISQKARPQPKPVIKNLPRTVGRPKSLPPKRIGGIEAFACAECDHSYTYFFELKLHQKIHKKMYFC